MAKTKKKNTKNKKLSIRIWKKIKWYVIAFATAGLLYNMMQGNFGFIKYYELSLKKERLKSEIITIKKQIDSLNIIIEKLDNDMEYIEKVAREKYNMIKEGETVYQIVPKKEE